MIFKAYNFLRRKGVVATLKKTRDKVRDKVVEYIGHEHQILRNHMDRSNYVYCCYHAAILASKLGHKKMSVIEFGCAGGAGLIALEVICAKVSGLTGVEIEIYGFDTGEGLPQPQDYRDLPYHWQKGFFQNAKGKTRAKT